MADKETKAEAYQKPNEFTESAAKMLRNELSEVIADLDAVLKALVEAKNKPKTEETKEEKKK